MRRLLFVFAVALLLLLPAGAFAETPSTGRLAAVPPAGILGKWNVSSYGLVEVRAVGSQYRGTVVRPVPDARCLPPGRETWEIYRQETFPPNAEIFTGKIEFFTIADCDSVGFHTARWDLTRPADAGVFCATYPGQPQECHGIERVGSGPDALAPFSISRVLFTCMIDRQFYASRVYLCNQLYYASKPGKVTTQIYYCQNDGYLSCPKDLSKCAVPPGYPPNRQCSDSLGRLAPRRTGPERKGKKSKKKLITVARSSLKFSAPGYQGMDITPSKKGRKKLKKLARHEKKITVVVASFFQPKSGGRWIVRAKRIKLDG